MSGRRQQREYAIKIVFAKYSNDLAVDEIIANLKQSDENAKKGIGKLCQDIAQASLKYRDKSDELILPRLKDWAWERIPKIDRVILWTAIAEMIAAPNTPESVIINEYLELAKEFSTEKSKRFINGVLDSIAKELRSA